MHPNLAEALMLDRLTITRVFADTDVLATVIVPATNVACPIRALAPDLIVMPLPAVPRTKLPLVAVIVPVVRVRPPVPFGVNVNPTAALVPVPVKTFPLVRLIAVAAVVVAKEAVDNVVYVLDTEPNVVQVAAPANIAPRENMFPDDLFTQICPNWYPKSAVVGSLFATIGEGLLVFTPLGIE
jgi:hypothetical protein